MPPLKELSLRELFENKNDPKALGNSVKGIPLQVRKVAVRVSATLRRLRLLEDDNERVTSLVNAETPTLKRGFLALNIASPSTRKSYSKKSPTPAKGFFDQHFDQQHSNDKALGYSLTVSPPCRYWRTNPRRETLRR